MHLCELMLDFGPVFTFWMYNLKIYKYKLKKNIKTNYRNGLECIDNDYPPALPFDLQMFQQVVNSLWYNVIGTKTSPPTTMPLKLQNLNAMNISLGENVLVNICIQKMKNISLLGQEFFSEQKKYRSSIVRVMFFCMKDKIPVYLIPNAHHFLSFYQNKLTESDITISNEKNRG
ncbi:hypothetical protein PHYBLDRAFT_176445 [Phycomyces blakesleeanus NRRL 1555(-)]|uniref:Uncharacterized protein n=1 Tax=Phycomyces blakesleeanus (strain ATCC 8743b / DSM 1359 / FGSC 10004 / NBRC 33097 / NRRL 1555) TaxID=763407 RepID=A0A162PF21_PHYB8|nr:hypothetical protein PHYBLDRAFT_176445 [Phycomyces blakesleeanus NRRL 1555(-)]OAD65076.1 hypothetical protein PHYBLDRAFT_176445 [Phycomyces blakesleeanus NRRL 1555(-)]|eukprot:XP_018283116.1 hypothetical protein PHYBLDRAFT_176445 [Phycomyces blakesleeanus NRRL 1555(-)]